MSWIRKALGLCSHKWAERDRFLIHRSLDGKIVGQMISLRCEHCGNYKRVRLPV